ncbi:MAG: tetratricopeptide repeat protein, partial [Gammaproteobacteria bacterium]
MILFKHKNSLAAAALVLTAVSLAACVQPPVKEGQPARPETATDQPDQPETTGPAAAAEQPPAAGVPGETLTAPLLYDVLLAEIAGQRGMLNVSGTSYLEAARQSEDPRIAERAFKISLYAKQPQLALESARRWVELAPDNMEARQSLGALALRTGESPEALEQFDSVVKYERAAGEEDPYQSVLVLLAREPDKERSTQIMEQLVARNPTDPMAHFAYARLAVHMEDWPLAEREVAQALKLRPDWTQALILNAQINLKQGKSDLARRQLETALQRKPADADLRMAYARLLVDLEDFDAARTEYRKLLKLEPDNGQVVYSLALLSLEAGQLDDARKM